MLVLILILTSFLVKNKGKLFKSFGVQIKNATSIVDRRDCGATLKVAGLKSDSKWWG